MAISFLGIDVAKNVFQLHGVDASGQIMLRRRVARSQLMEVILRLTPCTIGMEACGSPHHWAREFANGWCKWKTPFTLH